MIKESLLITGSTGTLGTALKTSSETKDFSLLTPSHSDFDITNYEQSADYCRRNHIDSIIHTAAMTNWENCQKFPEEALRINILGTVNMARLAAEHNSSLILISSDGVFPGTRKLGYSELDQPNNPTSLYGCSKLAAELLAQKVAPKSLLIARLGWFFGPTPTKDTKFVGLILRQLASGKKLLKSVFDKYGSLSYTPQVAEKIFSLLRDKVTGVRHIINAGSASRLEVAQKVVELWSPDATVEAVPSSFFPSPVIRPDYSILTTNYADCRLPFWQDALEDYHRQYPSLSSFIL